jgi:hypothetical protein
MTAHAAGGGWDELLLLIAVVALGFGVVRLIDRTRTRAKRMLGFIAIAVAIGVGSLPIAFGVGRVKVARIRPASTAKIAIVEPPAGAKLGGSTMRVALRLDGGTITPLTTTRLRANEGHIHVSIDGRLEAMTALVGEIDIKRLKRGTHTLRAEFVAGDHAPFATPVAVEEAFEKL